LAQKTQYITFGGDCVQYGLLAEKRIPLVVESYLKPFDYLPLVNIIEETGGIITDWQGKTLNFNSNGDVVASISAKAHKQFLKL
jgi:myo-inositol-1(or 4)-monophosphatase